MKEIREENLTLTLQDPVDRIPLIGSRYKFLLGRLDIFTVRDILHHYPFRYEDYSQIKKISELIAGQPVTVRGTIVEIKNIFTRFGKNFTRAILADETGKIPLVWFNQPFVAKNLPAGESVSISGKLGTFSGKPALINPDYEVVSSEKTETIHTGKLVPIYPETEGVSSKWLRSRINWLLENLPPDLGEFLPPEVLEKYRLETLAKALPTIHFPKNLEEVKGSHRRLGFDELLERQLTAQIRRQQWREQGKAKPLEQNNLQENWEKFTDQLPFALTGAQQRAVGEISADLDDDIPMNRILVGDVGSGKTVVAAAAIYQAYLNHTTSLYMAPTEILAQQHFQTLRGYLEPLGLKIELVTGSRQLAAGSLANVSIGTHALLYHLDQFKNIGLVVIDEQHRFGVEQRALLTQQDHTTNLRPHLLTMTATPIPRSLALALYGDLDLSYLDEMPPGRQPVKTWVVPPVKREAAYRWIEKQMVTEKSQAFIVCPFIEESETMQSVKAVTAEYGKLQKEVFPKLKIGLLHGKLKAKEKEATLEEFRRGGSHILLATPVVEVGVDIPNATIMVIEGAERFGLASLHQLRGRVGRGSKASYCLLFSESPSPPVYHRLKAMETIHDGLKLSELDLKNRGQGEIYGLVQHGLDKLKIASLDDVELLQATKQAAEELLQNFAHQPPFSAKLHTIKSALVNPD